MTWEVEEIRDFKDRRGKKEYPVHWKGYPDSDDSRVKEEDIDAVGLLRYRMLTTRHRTISPPTERVVVEAALRRSILGPVEIQAFINTLSLVPFENRLDILQRLDAQQNPSKSDSIIRKFIADHSHTTTKLRSGRKWLDLRKGEHRTLTIGEELPFEFVVDGRMREGGTAIAR